MTETLNLRPFDQLNKDEKIEAILAAVEIPVSKELALDYAGIGYDSLSQQEQQKIDEVFERNKSETKDMYIVGEEKRSQLSHTLDMQSVYAKIADNHWDTMFG